MAGKDNLTPFTKGDPRAIAGGKKSKRVKFDERMQKWLEKKIKKKPGQKTSLTYEDVFRQALMAAAVKGNIQAIKVAFDRAYGKASQSIDLSNSDGSLQNDVHTVVLKLPDNGTAKKTKKKK